MWQEQSWPTLMHYYICLQDLKKTTLVIRWPVFRQGFQARSLSSRSRIAANSSSTCSRIRSQLCYSFLGAFAELSKADISLIASVCLSVCLSVRPLGTTRLPLEEFSWNFFENLPRKFKFHLHLARKTGTLHEDLDTCIITSRSVLLKMGKLSGKIVEKIKIHILCSKVVIRKLCRLWDNVEK
jgi:hypothetical protein